MANAEEFRDELNRRFREALSKGLRAVDIIAREIHETVQQVSPTKTSRYPNVCSVMRQEQRGGMDEVISERASDGPNFAVRYRLPR